ncbi:hypothetical protein RKD18_004168 [Streptomyces phaeoluteigriseus]
MRSGSSSLRDVVLDGDVFPGRGPRCGGCVGGGRRLGGPGLRWAGGSGGVRGLGGAHAAAARTGTGDATAVSAAVSAGSGVRPAGAGRGGRTAEAAGRRGRGAAAGRVDERVDLPLDVEQFGQRLPQHVLAAAADEVVAGARVDEGDLEGGAVEARHLGVLAEEDPGEAAAVLDRLQDVGPERAGVEAAGGRGVGTGGRGGRGGGRSRGGCGGSGVEGRRGASTAARGRGGRPAAGPAPAAGDGGGGPGAGGGSGGRGGRARLGPRRRGGGRRRLDRGRLLGRRVGRNLGRLGGRRRGRGRRGAAHRRTGRCRAATRRDGSAGRGRGGHRVGLRTGDVSDGGHAGRGRSRGEVHPALDPVQAGHDRALVAVGGREQYAGADQLELEARRVGPAHLGEALVDEVGGAAQLGGAEDARLGLHPLDDVGGGVDQPLLRGVRDGGEDDEVPQPLQQVGDEPPRVVAPLDDPVHDLEGGGPVTGGERIDDGVEQRAVRVPEEGGRHGVCHTGLARAREELVHDGHGVTHGAGAGAHDERQDSLLDRDVLLLAHLAEVLPQRARRHEPEGVVVGPGPDGADDLLGLGGGEDELQVLRRLLDDLEQRVETGRRDHVGLVDDVDLVTAARRPEEGLFPQVTGVVHTTVRSGVDLDDVDGTRAGARQVLTGLALPAGGGGGALLAVQAAGQDARAGRLATSAGTAEQVRVIDPVVPQRLLQRVGDMLLPDDLGERLRAIAAVQRERRHAYEVIGAHRQPAPPRKRKRPPRTRQSRPTLAAFRPWGSSVR